MPNYRFRILEGGRETSDIEHELQDDAAACTVALIDMAESLQDAPDEFWRDPSWMMSVAAPGGAELCRVEVGGIQGPVITGATVLEPV